MLPTKMPSTSRLYAEFRQSRNSRARPPPSPPSCRLAQAHHQAVCLVVVHGDRHVHLAVRVDHLPCGTADRIVGAGRVGTFRPREGRGSAAYTPEAHYPDRTRRGGGITRRGHVLVAELMVRYEAVSKPLLGDCEYLADTLVLMTGWGRLLLHKDGDSCNPGAGPVDAQYTTPRDRSRECRRGMSPPHRQSLRCQCSASATCRMTPRQLAPRGAQPKHSRRLTAPLDSVCGS